MVGFVEGILLGQEENANPQHSVETSWDSGHSHCCHSHWLHLEGQTDMQGTGQVQETKHRDHSRVAVVAAVSGVGGNHMGVVVAAVVGIHVLALCDHRRKSMSSGKKGRRTWVEAKLVIL